MSSVVLNNLAATRVEGEDAGAYLQAQLTADLTLLADGGAGFAGYCDPGGRLIAVLYVIRRQDTYILIAACTLMDKLLAELRKYVLRAKVSLEQADSKVLGNLDGEGFQYSLDEASETPQLSDTSMADAWRARELRAGITWLNPETTGQFLPQMIGLERLGGLSFRKGCFPGQEVIARVRYLGKVKRLPVVVLVAGRFETVAGTEVDLLCAESKVGTAVIVDSAPEQEDTLVFLVSRAGEDIELTALESAGRRLEIRETVQTWATM